MPNPFALEDREIVFISDPPHLIKTVRKQKEEFMGIIYDDNNNYNSCAQ